MTSAVRSSSNPATARNVRLAIAAMAACNAADMLIWLRPPVIAEYLNERAISNSQAGLIATSEMVALALTMMLWTRFVGPIKFRTIAVAGLLTTISMTVASMFVTGFPMLLAVRIVAAIGFGMLSLVPTMAIASLPNAQKVYGWMYTVSMTYSAGVLTQLTWVGETFGRAPGLPAYVLFAAILIPFALLMPGDAICRAVREPQGEGEGEASASTKHRLIFLAAGMAIVGLAFHVVWTFFMMLGGRAGLSAEQTGTVMSLSTLGSIAGSLLSAPLSRVIGAGRVLMVAVLSLGASLMTVLLIHDGTVFAIAGIGVLVALFLIFPAVMGSAAEIDPSGRGSALANAFSMLGGAVGPYVAGLSLDWFGYGSLSVIVLVACAAALALFMSARVGGVRVKSGPIH